MGVLFKNDCKYKNCGLEFENVAALIRHIEQVHVFVSDNEETRGYEHMIALSKILPNNIEDVQMGIRLCHDNRAPQLHTALPAYSNENATSSIQSYYLDATNSHASPPSSLESNSSI
ncbi:uncharacterized protein LOC119670799 [Teleopsis dalmanni]|uniref:uncharacterized protein LOC119663625 n=1 Tax=Teleopsis dalmanni TaxID=139649 RepID=UPI0018CD267A|nr:uncharacterized protein LOC119663625 [Teleopsis dalmanni]XP_037937140.1 uncharacterized protein LOC119670799 [Teleopsis dalmanni]